MELRPYQADAIAEVYEHLRTRDDNPCVVIPTGGGKTLLAESISQGQPDGWPAYRLEWQTLGSSHRRLRACFQGVRAEPFAAGSPEFIALELYVAWRGEGLAIETPAVRR